MTTATDMTDLSTGEATAESPDAPFHALGGATDEASDLSRADRVRPAFRLPHGLTSTRFGLLIGAILVAGLVALLAVNTSLAAGSIELGGLESTLARTTEQQQALDLTVENLSSAQSLQARAIALGMVPAPAPAFLDAATGKISGQLLPALAGSATQTGAPMVTAPEPAPAPSASTSPAPEASGVEPPARLVMPPDPGVDGATLTRPAPARAAPGIGDLPDRSAAGQDGEPVLQDEPSDDAAAIVGGAR